MAGRPITRPRRQGRRRAAAAAHARPPCWRTRLSLECHLDWPRCRRLPRSRAGEKLFDPAPRSLMMPGVGRGWWRGMQCSLSAIDGAATCTPGRPRLERAGLHSQGSICFPVCCLEWCQPRLPFQKMKKSRRRRLDPVDNGEREMGRRKRVWRTQLCLEIPSLRRAQGK